MNAAAHTSRAHSWVGATTGDGEERGFGTSESVLFVWSGCSARAHDISRVRPALASYTLRRRVLRAASADAVAASLASANRRAVALRTEVRRVPRTIISVKRRLGPTDEPSGQGPY